jgi:hypothetical protein
VTDAPDITAIVTVHREGLLAGLSLRSLLESIAEAEARGLRVEKIVVMDRTDQTTRDVFADASALDMRIVETDFGDQGRARNEGVACATGTYLAFLDGDDLWGYNWLCAAWDACQHMPGKMIAHPQLNWFFEGSDGITIHTDQFDPLFDPEFFRFNNYWDAMCMAPREAHVRIPYHIRELDKGFAFEDWRWNCETMEAGYVHRVVPDTVHFKRRREQSQTLSAAARGALVRPTGLFDYDWYTGKSGAGRTSVIDK